jgi:hypothetical protein
MFKKAKEDKLKKFKANSMQDALKKMEIQLYEESINEEEVVLDLINQKKAEINNK